MQAAGVPGLIVTPQEFNLVLDPGICYFVLIPIFLVVFMRTVLSQNVSELVTSKPVLTQRDRIQHAQVMRRTQRTRGACHWIPKQKKKKKRGLIVVIPKSFLRRCRFLIGKALAPVEVAKAEPGEQNYDELANMVSMMKGNTASYISNIGFMIWVNSFFAGFLLVRLPFNLTETLRPLVQRDIVLDAFDCSYVSSLSWYFITFFGLRLLLGGESEDLDMKMMRDQMSGMAGPMMPPGAGGMPGMGSQYDPNPMFKTERNELQIVRHEWACADADKKLLRKWTD
ncbi:hypothetical protein RFI_13335 [Reticulomyxa filosa]|uniref:ER membrane protein complex subunit 3 n=1 Tax=Reticulomyxa filosa TaxID=46433 RepID=X6NDJ3_RETFI|nr:hypothetical protein RFI_13335 [Reticulomyxa filosa]|eukprot:ETO23834.1 hypothetical protein RFI_13335 [Reticulomyxa filosa]